MQQSHVTQSPYQLPADLPVPVDDGAALHLLRSALPAISLPATGGRSCNLADLSQTPCVFFFYPRTGIPGQPPALGFRGEDWDSIPGARGCTPQSCGFRDLHDEFRALGTRVFGISTNTSDHQREFKSRTHCPFEFLSDADLALTRTMRLPTFEFPVESGGPSTLIRRMAWFCDRGRVRRIWYPVFPPDENARTVLAWLRARAAVQIRPIARNDLEFVRQELRTHWMSTTICSIGRSFEADTLPGFVAMRDATPVGLLTMHLDERGLEVVTLSSRREDAGVGTMLLEAAENFAREHGAARLFLTTSNDNLRAIRFYQRFGLRLVAVHRGMMDRYRDEGKPIPLMGLNGIPLRDELELEIVL